MMDRNREARRGAMAAVNGGGLSRRRQQRTTNLRDSPEEDGAMVMPQEPSRLRDRGIKKDRDQDRERSSSRNKRRRGDRSMHSNREEGDDSSEESIEEEDDDEEEDASVMLRLPTTANLAQIPSSSSSIQQQNHHHLVKKSSLSANNNGRSVRLPAPSWKVAEEMIGVSIPRKARSSSLKRSQECGDVIHQQASTSPARPSPTSTAAVSPSSSNASMRKKKISSGVKQLRPPKIAKSSAAATLIQEIEIEVAEVLYGMTRQAAPLVNKQENCKVDSQDMEAKSSVCSPNSISQPQSIFPSSNSPMVATAPKRKRPRLRFDEETPASPSTKMESELPAKTEEVSSPKSEKNTSASPAIENGVGSSDPGDTQQDSAKLGSCNQVPDSKVSTDGGEEGVKKEDDASKPREASCADANDNHEEATAEAKVENLREEKFSIDLMAPPPLPEKSSSDKDGILDFVSDHKCLGPEKKMLPSLDIAIGETEKTEEDSKQEVTAEDAGNFLAQDFDLKKQAPTEKSPDLQLDLGKHDQDGLSPSAGSKRQPQVLKQHQKSARIDPKQEKSAPLTSMPLPVPIAAGWPGGFPSFGYIGQVPSLQAVVPMEGNLGAAKTVQPQPPHFLQPQMRPKRCATHGYIAQNIHYHQQIARMHPFWPAAAAAVNVAKQYNLNAVPPTDSAAILGNPLQGGFPPPRSSGPLQDKSASLVALACTGPSPKDKSSATAASAPNINTFTEAAQRKQFLLPQSSHSVSSATAPHNMIHGPAFLFPINQQPAVANRSGAPSKPTPPTGNAAPSSTASTSSAAAGSGATGHSTTTMRFNYTGLSPEAQYMTILQNNAILPNPPYPFPLATAHFGGPPPFRGTVPAQAMPFFNGPFYSPQMVPSQQQQQLVQQQQQPNHQNPSTSSSSSSSQKHNTQQQHHHHHQQRVPGGSNSHSFPPSKQPLHLLPHQARQIESEATCEDSPSTADSSRASQAPKGIYGQNFAMPMHSQNFALISPASAAGGSHGENKQPPMAAHQHQALKVDITPSQAYAMSFASFGGSPAAAVAATPGLDFSAIVQNPAMLQNLPEVARHGYPPAVAIAAAAAVAQQTAQNKKSHHENGKSVGDTTAANAKAAADDGKIATVTLAAKSVAQQHSVSFPRFDNDPSASNIMINHADASSRALNLLHPPVTGTQASNPSSTAPSTTVTNSSSSLPLPLSQSKQQHYHQMLQFQHQHQHSQQQQQQQQQRMLYMQQQPSQLLKEQQMLLQQQMASRQQMMSRTGKPSSAHNTSSSGNISSTTMSARFPQGGLAGFPPSLIQQSGNSSPSQSPQWKTTSTNRAANQAPASSATSSSSSAKNQIPQQQQPTKQQQQQQQQPLLNPNAHHTQISFGVSTSSNKPSVSSSTAATAIATGSPQNSFSKSSAAAGGGGNGGSPRALSTSKSVQPPVSMLPTLPLQQQHAAAKSSPSAAVSSLKPSSPIRNSNSNRNMTTSILGHPHITPSNSSSSKKVQPHQQQSQKQQPFQQPQFFFNNSYIQAQTSQRRQTEQPNSTATTTTTSGMISLNPSSLTSDPAKAAVAAAAASNVKGLTTQQQQQAGILQHGTQFVPATSMAPNPFMSAAFNYVQVMPPSSVSVKPASAAATGHEQKQSSVTGNENVHACWKPEKR